MLDKLRIGYHTKSIIEDLDKAEKSTKSSEESSRTIHELGNIELHELGQISRVVQCQSCLKHIPEGLIFCSCGICLRPVEELIQRIKARFEAMIIHYYLARLNYSRGNRHGEAQCGKRDHWKAMDAQRGARRTITNPSCSDGRMTKSIENLRKFMDGQKIIADTWTTSRRSTSATAQPGTSGTCTKTPSSWYPVMMIGKLDRCEREKTLCRPRKLSQIFDENEDDRIPKNERARQRPFDEALRADLEWHSPDWKLNRRKLPHHHLHNNGGNTNTKTLNGEITIGGKSGGYRLFQSHIGFFFTDFACRHQRMSCTRRRVKTEHLVARTFLLSVAHFDHHTHLRVQVWDVLHLCAS